MFKGLKKRIADGMEGVSPGRQSPLQPRLDKKHVPIAKPNVSHVEHWSNADTKNNNQTHVNGVNSKKASPREVLARVHHLLEVGKAQAQNNGLLDSSPGANAAERSFDDPLNSSHPLNSSGADVTPSTPIGSSTPAVLPVTPQRTQRRLSNSSNYSAAGDERSDVESDLDHTPRNDNLTKDDIYQMYKKQERTLQRYKSKFSELVDAYKGLQKDKEKLEGALTAGQDKQLRRISELKETIELEQTAKRHLEETLRMSLDEKDEVINVLQTQVHLLKSKGDESEGDASLDSSLIGGTPLNGTLTEKVSDMEGVIRKQKEEISKLKFQSKDARDVIIRLEQEKKSALHDMMSNARVIADSKDDLEKEVILLRQQIEIKGREMDELRSSNELDKKRMEEEIKQQVIADGLLRKDREAEILFKQKEEEMKSVLASKIGDFQRVIEDKERQKNDAVKYKDDVIKKLEEKVAKLDKSCQDYLDEKQQMESTLDKLKADKIDLLGIVQAKEEDVANLTKHNEEQNGKKEADLKATQNESQQQLTKIKRASQKKIVELQEVIKSNETFLKELQEKHAKEIEDKNKEYENAKQADLNRTKKIVKDLRGKVQEKDALVEKTKAEMDAMIEQMKLESSGKSNLEVVTSKLEEDVKSKEEENESLKNRLHHMEKEYTTSVQDLLAKHNSLVESHRVELDELQKSCADNERLLDESKSSFENVVESLSIATGKVDNLEKQLREKQEFAEEKDAICRTLADDLEMAKQQSDQERLQRENDFKSAKEGMEKTVERLQEELASVKRMHAAEVDLKTKMASQGDVKLSNIEEVLNATKAELCKEQDSRSMLEGTVASLRQLNKEEATKHEAETNKLQALIDNMKVQVADTQTSASQFGEELKTQLLESQEEARRFQTESASLSERLEEANGQINGLASELKNLQDSFQETEESYKQSAKQKDEEVDELKRVVEDWRMKLEEQEDLFSEKVKAMEEQKREQAILMEKELDSRLTEKEDDLRQRMNDFMKEKDMSMENVSEQFEKMRKEEIADIEERNEKRLAALQEDWEARLSAGKNEETAKIETMQGEHNATLEQLQERIDNLTRDKDDSIKSFVAKLEEMQDETEKHVKEKEGLEQHCKELEEKLSTTISSSEARMTEINESHHHEALILKQKREEEIGELCSKHEQDLLHWKKARDDAQVEKDGELIQLQQQHSQNCEALKTEITSLQSNVQSLEQALEMKDAEYKVVLTQELESAAGLHRTKLERLEADMASLESNHAESLTAETNKWQEKVKLLQSKYKKIVEDKSAKGETVLTQVKEDHAGELERITTEFNKERENLHETVKKLQENLKEKSEMQDNFEKQLEEHVQRLRSQEMESEQKIEQLSSEKNQLCQVKDNEICALVDELKGMKEQGRGLEDAIEGQNGRQNELLEQIRVLETDKEAATLECSSLKDALERQSASHADEIASLKETSFSDIDSVKQKHESMLSAQGEKEKEQDAKMQEVSEQAKTKLMDMKKKAEMKISNLKKQHASTIETKDEEITRLKASLDEATSSSSALTASASEELERLKQNFESQCTQRDAETAGKLESQEGLLSEKELTITSLNGEISELKDKMESMLVDKVEALKMLKENLQDDHQEEVKRIEAEFQQKVETIETRLTAKVEEKEFEYSSRVKQIVKEFQQKLNEKEREVQEATENALDSSQKEEKKIMDEYNEQIIEYKREMKMREDDMKALQQNTEEKLSTMQAMLNEREEEHTRRFAEIEKDYDTRLNDITKRHESEIDSLTSERKQGLVEAEQQRQSAVSEIEKTYCAQIEALKTEHQNDKSAMEKKLKTQMKKNQLEMKKLIADKGKTLHPPGKLMEDVVEQSSPATSNPSSDNESDQVEVTALKMQLAAMAKELSLLRDREAQFQNSLQPSRPATLDVSTTEHNNSYSGFPSSPIQSPEPTQFEYMKKILFEFMMGRQKTQMAKVLTAIAQFSPTQTRQVLEKIQQSDSVVGLFG